MEAALKAGLPFLPQVLGLGAELEKSSAEERQSARRFTIGGLHMNVLDALTKSQMIKTISLEDVPSAGIADTYVEIIAEVRATEYYSLISIAKVLVPLIIQSIDDVKGQISSEILKRNHESPYLHMLQDLRQYETALADLIEWLEADYLTAKQLEMLMIVNSKILGVVELNVDGQELVPELRAKLTGGTYLSLARLFLASVRTIRLT